MPNDRGKTLINGKFCLNYYLQYFISVIYDNADIEYSQCINLQFISKAFFGPIKKFVHCINE